MPVTISKIETIRSYKIRIYINIQIMLENDKLKSFNELLSNDPNPGTSNRIKRVDKITSVPGWLFDDEKESVEIPYKTLSRKLKTFNLVDQDVYDILNLGLLNIKDRPLCPICNKPNKFRNLYEGYGKTCGSTYCIKESIRRNVKNLWKEENYKKQQSNSHIAWASKEENLKKMSEISLNLWKSDEYRIRQHNSHVAWTNKEENLRKMSEIATSLWQDKNYREKQIRSHKDFVKNNPHKVMHGLSGKTFSFKTQSSYLNYDSSWEKEFILVVNELDDIISIERVNFFIPYLLNEEEHSYFPDFRVEYNNGKKLLVEIKANWMIERDEKTRLKIIAGRSYVEKSKEFDEYLLLKDEDFCDAPYFIKINRELIKKALLKHKN